MNFPGPWIDCCEMRQASRLPSLSLRDCQQINRSSQYSNSPPIEPIFSIASLNLCFPWSRLSLCLCPMKVWFRVTVIMFPSQHMIAWPGPTDLSQKRKLPSSPDCFHAALQMSLCIDIFCTWCSGFMGLKDSSREWGAGSGVCSPSPASTSPYIGCFSHRCDKIPDKAVYKRKGLFWSEWVNTVRQEKEAWR